MKISSNIDVGISEFLMKSLIEWGIAVLLNLILIFNNHTLTDRQMRDFPPLQHKF